MITATQTIRIDHLRIDYLSMPTWLEDGLFYVAVVLLMVILLSALRSIAIWRRHRALAARGFEVNVRQ